MSIEYVSAEGRSRSYRLLAVILGALALAGLISFAISYEEGHQVFGVSNVIPWGMPIVLAIYLIGLSAGSLILSSLTYVFGREQFKPIARIAVYLAIVLIFGAMLAIAVDLGRPEKFWRLFMLFYLNNMTSMFAINSILYGGYFVISLVYLGLIFANAKYIKAVGILAVCWAVLVHMGTGAIFGFIAARQTWYSAVKPLEFVGAALTSGMALLILVVTLTMRFTGRPVKRDMIVALGRLLAVFIVGLLVLLVLENLTNLYPAARDATVYMLTGKSSWIFWSFQIGMGIVIPLTILVNPRLNKTIRWVCIASLSVVIGVFFERYYLVIPGLAYPFPLYPGQIQGMWGVTGSYPITPLGMLLSIGLVATVALLFVLGLKNLELLPSRESDVTEDVK